MKNIPQAPFTVDGHIERQEMGKLYEKDGAPAMNFTMVTPFTDDVQEGRARELHMRQGRNDGSAVLPVSRSAWAQVGLRLEQRDEIRFKYRHALVPVTITSHRGAVRDQLLSFLRVMVKNEHRQVTPGGLLFVSRESALTAAEIQQEMDDQKLLLPDGTRISSDGVVGIPLSGAYAFGEEIFDENAMRQVIHDGRHGMRKLRKEVPLPKNIPPGGFLLGSMRGLSLGRVQGIIQEETNVTNVSHLPAFVLDALRTMGPDPRQAEILNKSGEPVDTASLRVLLRLHRANEATQAAAARVLNGCSLRWGTELRDLVQPEEFIDLAETVSPHKSATGADGQRVDQRPQGLLIGRDRATEIPWASHQEFQNDLILSRARRFVAANRSDRSDGWVDGQGIPEPARGLAGKLGFVSKDQHGKVLVTGGFPDPQIVREMLRDGIGVFVARSLHMEPDAFAADIATPLQALHPENDTSSNDAKSMKRHALFFDTSRYEAMRVREKEGAKFFMVLRDMVDEMSAGAIIPAHVREFDRGLWVKPDMKERLRKVKTIIAMYGSHVKGMDKAFLPQLQKFMRDMKELFGEELGITHGKGPGIMKIADDAAAMEEIPRIGIGICVEGQAGNCRPEAMVDFFDTDRLRRQKVMDDIATFKMFNLGGAGTLEEAAISLCSQKLGKKAITPMIFVDPSGTGRDGSHLWEELRALIETLATPKSIRLPDSEKEILVSLLQEETPRYIHCVQSYDEAAKTIREFATDPEGYYRQRKIPPSAVAEAMERQESTLEQTGFKSPTFLELYRPGSRISA